MVHELGHNLGMKHDHDDAHIGTGCDKQGFMSYYQHLYGWTDCNRRDLLIHYNTILKYYDDWCLKGKGQKFLIIEQSHGD